MDKGPCFHLEESMKLIRHSNLLMYKLGSFGIASGFKYIVSGGEEISSGMRYIGLRGLLMDLIAMDKWLRI